MGEAYEDFQRAAGARSTPERWYAEGAVHLAAQRFEAAERAFYAGLTAGESRFYLKIAHGWGQALHALERYAEAAGVFEKLAQRRPDLLDPIIWLGNCWIHLGRAEEALGLHRRALQTFADHEDIARIRADGALALDRLGRWREGLAWCEASLQEAAAPAATLVFNKATFHFRLDDLAGARASLRRAAALGPAAADRAAQTWRAHGDGSAL